MQRASFRFYAELNDFLPPVRRARTLECRSYLPAPVKDLIESFGVPHTEVDLIVANGESVGFTYLVRDGDRISVYPVFESIDITPVLRVRPQPLRETRFVLDAHLGRLAGYLRMAGFDTLYRNDASDEELAAISKNERRILLTRDRGLLKRSAVTHGCYVRETNARSQLEEVLRRFDLSGRLAPFTRCLRCNQRLAAVAKDEVAERLPPQASRYYEEFWQCAGCGKIYWQGSHYRRMSRFLERIQQAVSPS